MAKLFIVVRSDLEPGAQAAQCCHAYGEFEEEHPAIYRAWKAQHQNIVLLAARDENHLNELVRAAAAQKLACSTFREPDLGRSLTAIALEDGARKLLSSLPLALRSRRLDERQRLEPVDEAGVVQHLRPNAAHLTDHAASG